MRDDNTIICRCEDLTLGKLRQLVAQGYTTMDELKRISRAGMGPCQGRTCRAMIERELATLLGIKPGQLPVATHRQPSKPVKMGAILGGERHD